MDKKAHSKYSQDKETGIQKFTRLLSRSSQKLMSSFIDEDQEKEKVLNQLYQQINQAISQKSIVVLQYQEPKQAQYETLVGRLYQHSKNPDSLVIKLQKNNEIRMISAKFIKKISISQTTSMNYLSLSK